MNIKLGHKAGSGSQRKPVTAPDSASSKSYARIVYGINDGHMVGFIDGLKSLILDNTPVQSSSGEMNITEVEVQTRWGTNDQDYLEGFPSVVNEIGYNNVEIVSDHNFVHYVNDLNTNAVGIRFTWGKIFRQNESNGDIYGYRIDYAIDVQTDGNGFVEVLRTALNDKTSSGYERYHRLELPPAEVGWEIRVRRLTANTASDFIGDKMYLSAVAEIVDAKLRYPNTALIALKFDADKFGSIPKADFRLRGKIIKVPTNYYPETRAYAVVGEGTTNGIWDGSFKLAYTNNPVWIFYDLLLSKRYGLGERLDASMVDKWALYSIGQYCDVMVPDGMGGTEPRLTCNVYINSKYEAFDLLMQLASTFRGILHWDGASIVATADRPSDPVFTFTRANIIGEFNYSGTRARDRSSMISVAFDDPANNYKTDKEVVSDTNAIAEVGVRLKELTAFGCTSRGQAQRIGRLGLLKEQQELRMVTFTVGLDGYIPVTGKIIEIADPLLAGRAIGGRISVVSSDGLVITLDREVTANVGDVLVANGDDGIQQRRDITKVNGNVVTVSAAFSGVSAENVWAIDSEDLSLMRFRVLSVAQNRSDDGLITFTISGVQHNPSIDEGADFSAYIEQPTYSNIEIYTQVAPTELVIGSENVINQGLDITNVVFSWPQAVNAVKYELEWRRDNGSWIKAPIIYSNTFVVEDVYHGLYEARIVAINSMDVRSLYTIAQPTTINSKFAEPPMLSFIQATGIQFGAEISWVFPARESQNAEYVEVQISYREDKSDAKLLGNYAYPLNRAEINGLQANLKLWVKARIIDRNKVEGPWTIWVSTTTDADASILLDALNGKITSSQLDQDLNQSIILGSGAAQTAEAAQNAANAAAQAATNAQAAADQVQAQVTTTTTELRGLLTTTADGLTQEILDRQNGDADVVGQLTMYKTSNDAAMSAVQQQAEAATSASSANATALTNLNTEVAAAHNLASNALQQAQSATDATSTNASNLIALNSRMDSAVQAGDNLLINSNVDKPYNGNYPHGVYDLGEAWEVGATYTLLWCASHKRAASDTVTSLAPFAGDWTQGIMGIVGDGTRQVFKTTFVASNTPKENCINFFLLGANGGYFLDTVATVHWAVLVKASDISTKVWVRSKYDIDNAINAKLDASAINEYYTKVQADQAIAGQITTFESSLALGGGWMDIGREGAQPTIESGAGTIEVIDRTLNHFKITATNDGALSAYIGACNNSSAIPVGTPYVMTGKIRASRANLYDRIYARFNQHSSESYINGWNASSDWVTFKASGVTNTQDQHPVYNIIGAYVPNAIAGDWVEFKDCRISVNSDNVTAANSQAIRNTETAIATVDGKVTAQATDILNLSTGLTNLNNSKLDASIIQQYRTAVDQDSVTAGELTQFKSALKIGGDNLFTGTKTFNNQNNDLATSTFHPNYAGFGDHWVTDAASLLFGTHTLVQCKSHWRGFYYRPPIDSAENWFAKEDMVVSFWAASMGGGTNVYGIAGGQGYIFSVTTGEFKQYSMFIPKGTAIRTSDNKGIIEFAPSDGATLYYGGVMLQYGSKATAWQPSLMDSEIDTSQFASATALEQTNTNVNNMNGVLTAHTNQLSQQQASIDSTREIITIRDTRTDNQPPTYYRRWFAKQEVREFKMSTVIGLPLDYPYFCTLVTTTQWQDASGGAVQQRVEFDENRMNLYRKSNDPTDDWTPWSNTVVGTLNAKADATRVEEINNKVTQTENSIAALSETTTQHTATLGEISKTTLSKQHVLDLSQLDANVYYPIGMYVNTRGTSRILLTRSLGDFPETALPVWATHGAGFTAKCEWTTNGSGWGANTIERTILSVDSLFTANNQPSFGLVAQIGTASLEFIMVRGGAKYYLQTSSLVSDPAILTAPTDYNGTVLQPAPWRGEAIAGNTWSNWDVLTTQSTNASATALEQVKTQVQELDGQVTALSVETNTLSTTVGNNTAAIQLQQSSIDGINAKATLQVEAGGTIGGVALGNNGGVVDFLIRSNTFAVAPPVGYSGSNKYLMTYRATPITLPNGTVVSEGLYLNNLVVDYIDASKIYATSLSAISAELGTIKVGSANIADAAIKSAKIEAGAIQAAHIGNAQIVTAHIGDLQVDTLKIKNDAVTVGVSVNNAKTISIVSGGGKVLINIGVQANLNYVSASNTFTLKRNGTTIKTWTVYATPTYNGFETIYAFIACYSLPQFTDNPAAGTNTYEFLTGVWQANMVNVSMSLLETKK